jgi:vacuolar-type H+-ATPase subunit H
VKEAIWLNWQAIYYKNKPYISEIMKKNLKRILKITAIILLFLIVSIILLPVLFKGKIIDMVKEEANKSLNAKLEFADLKLSLIKHFPNVTAELKDLKIIGIDSFATDTLVMFKSFSATLDLMSVISGDEIKVKKLFLNEPDINIIVLKNGTSNYDIVKQDTTVVEKKTDEEIEDSNFKIHLKKFEIINGNLIYDDRSSEIYALLENINFVLSGDLTEDITNLDINMQIDSLTVVSEGVKYLSKVNTLFDSEISADLLKSIYSFKDNNLKLNEINLGFDGFVEMPEDDIKIDVTFNSKETTFKDALSMVPAIYSSDFEGVETSGKFQFNGYVKGTMTDSLMPGYGINLFVNNAWFKYPDLPKSINDINITAKIDAKEGTGDDITVDLKNFSMTMAGNPFKASALIVMSVLDVSMNGNVKGIIDLGSIKDIVPLEDTEYSGTLSADLSFKGNLSDIENENYDKFDAKGSLGMNKIVLTMPDMPLIKVEKAEMIFSPQFVDLKQFDALVGKSDLHLKGNIDNLFSYVFKDELLSGSFQFTSSLLDLNELTASSSETEDSEAENDEDNQNAEFVEIPSNLDFTLNTSLKKLLFEKLILDDVEGLIVLRNSKLDMKHLNMKALGGTMEISGSYDAVKPSEPVADLKLHVTDISIPHVYESFETVKKYIPVAKNSTGTISAGISFLSVLDNEMMPIYSSINSNGNISSDNIGISGNRLFGYLADKTKQEKFRTPKLNNLNIAYEIKNGNLTVKPSKFKIAGSDITFGGIQKLDKSIDFDLGMMLSKNIAGNLISKFPVENAKNEIDVNAKIGGTLDDPKIIGFSSSLTDNLKDEVKEIVEEKIENVKEKADQILNEAKQKAELLISEAEKQAQIIRENANKAGNRLISEAEKNGSKIVNEAKNPIAKKAAEITKKEMVEKAKKEAENLNKKADSEANSLVNNAKQKANTLINDAKIKAGI